MMLALNSPTTAIKTLIGSHAEAVLIGSCLAIAMGGGTTLPVHASEVPARQSQAVKTAAQPRSLSDGIYLYGQSAKANQIGRTYLVFQVRDRAVTGAIYAPFSSFDCFKGTVQPNRLALTITNSYEQTQSAYAIALLADSRVATTANPPLEAIKLAGYHPIQAVSDNDSKLLSTCTAQDSAATDSPR
jgi:hypothetical protein